MDEYKYEYEQCTSSTIMRSCLGTRGGRVGEEGEVWSPVSISSSLLSYISASLHNNRGRNEGRREREGGRGVIGKRVERVGGKRKGEGGREGRTLSI